MVAIKGWNFKYAMRWEWRDGDEIAVYICNTCTYRIRFYGIGPDNSLELGLEYVLQRGQPKSTTGMKRDASAMIIYLFPSLVPHRAWAHHGHVLGTEKVELRFFWLLKYLNLPRCIAPRPVVNAL